MQMLSTFNEIFEDEGKGWNEWQWNNGVWGVGEDKGQEGPVECQRH